MPHFARITRDTRRDLARNPQHRAEQAMTAAERFAGVMRAGIQGLAASVQRAAAAGVTLNPNFTPRRERRAR